MLPRDLTADPHISHVLVQKLRQELKCAPLQDLRTCILLKKRMSTCKGRPYVFILCNGKAAMPHLTQESTAKIPATSAAQIEVLSYYMTKRQCRKILFKKCKFYALGSGPNSLSPLTPSFAIRTINQIQPTQGISKTNIHGQGLPIS